MTTTIYTYMQRGRKIVKIRGAKICHVPLWLERFIKWDYENPILQYMYAHDNIHNNYIIYKT